MYQIWCNDFPNSSVYHKYCNLMNHYCFQFLSGEEHACLLSEVHATKVRQIYLCAAVTDIEYSL